MHCTNSQKNAKKTLTKKNSYHLRKKYNKKIKSPFNKHINHNVSFQSQKMSHFCTLSATPNKRTAPITMLGIETSCDDTSIAIVDENRNIHSNAALSQLFLHQIHGGVVPTMAMRQHAITVNYLTAKSLLDGKVVSIPHKNIVKDNLSEHIDFLPPSDVSKNARHPVYKHDLQIKNTDTLSYHQYLAPTSRTINWLENEIEKLSQFTHHLYLRGDITNDIVETQPYHGIHVDIDAISATFGPGLSGSLGVGVDTSKALSKWLNIPIIPVNHIIAHTSVGSLVNKSISYPYLGLVISGGHTQMNYVEHDNKVTVLSSTVDDAVGEAFDKLYRTLSMQNMNIKEIEKVIINEKTKISSLYKKLHQYLTENVNTSYDNKNNNDDDDNNNNNINCYNSEHFPLLNNIEKQNKLLVELTAQFHNTAQEQPDQQPIVENNNKNEQLESTQTLKQSNGQQQHQADFNHALMVESHMQTFINTLQTIPDKIANKNESIRHIGHVTDLYNQAITPPALHETFQYAYSILEKENNKSSGDKNLEEPLSLLPSDGHLKASDIVITPQYERKILTELSHQKKVLPHGAIIEKASELYIDIYHILQCYEYLIQRVLNITTPLLEKWYDQLYNQQANHGLLRKSSQVIPGHRFLPKVPLPLPLHNSGTLHSWTAMSMSGLKTKLRQYIEQEWNTMHEISTNGNDLDRLNIPVYLHHLLEAPISDDVFESSQKHPHVSNLFRLTCCAQLQSTVTEHLVDKMTRVLTYMNCSLPQQSQVLLLDQPQPLPFKNTLQMSGSQLTNVPTKAFTSSILPTDKPLPIVIGGGVACNKFITSNIKHYFNNLSMLHPNTKQPLYFDVSNVPSNLCGDNGIMIAWSGLQLYKTYHDNDDNQNTDNYNVNKYESEPISPVIPPNELIIKQKELNQQFEDLRSKEPDKHISRCLEQFTYGYQQPKWPLFEVFIEKPLKPVKNAKSPS